MASSAIALAARFGGRREPTGDVAPPALEHALPGDHSDPGALEARRGRHVQPLRRTEVDTSGGRGRPRARTALGPPPAAQGGSAHQPDHRLAVALEPDDRPPARATRAVVVCAVDPVEDPSPRGEAWDRPDLLADERVLRLLCEDQPEHRLLDQLVCDRHRRAIALRREAQLIGPKVQHRHPVRFVRQPVCEHEVSGEVAHLVSLPRRAGSRSRGITRRPSGLMEGKLRKDRREFAMATATTSVKKALETQADLKDRREHCAPAARALASLGSGPRQQVRIHHDDEFALYTVSELLHETTDSVVRMGLGGRKRLQSRGEFEGGCWTRRSSIRTCPTTDARDAGELVERLDDDEAPKRTSSPSPPTVATSRSTPTTKPSGWPSASARTWPARGGQRAGGRTAAPSIAGTSPPRTSTRSASPCSTR